MIEKLINELRAHRVPVGMSEALSMAKAMSLGLHENSLTGLYQLGRALLIHSERHLDAFDLAFAKVFQGIEVDAAKIHEALLSWLETAKDFPQDLERQLQQYTPDELAKMLKERLAEQKERHDGGSKWIGTGGTSPFGNRGAKRPGVRVGGAGGNRSAIHVAGDRLYQDYRDDLVLDIRQIGLALRRLRILEREGAETELDLEKSIAETARSGGELEVRLRRPRRTSTRVILMMDVGGSMDPHAHVMERLFSAAKKASHFKELRTYYFHNCIYGKVYDNARFERPLALGDLMRDCAGPQYKLIIVGDAAMAPYELLDVGGFLGPDRVAGLDWLRRLRSHFTQSVWLNPEPKEYWYGTAIPISETFPMFPMTLSGLTEAMTDLVRRK